jgi:hypothetical protein
MCFGATTLMALQVGSSLIQGNNAKKAANAEAAMLRDNSAQEIEAATLNAASERDAYQAQAGKLLKATRRERGAARAAIAASGTALDEFALMNEQYIQEAGETDAAMTILTGERRGRAIEREGQQRATAALQRAGLTEARGRNAQTASILNAGMAVAGWKGAKTGISDDGYSMGLGPAYGGSRRGL